MQWRRHHIITKKPEKAFSGNVEGSVGSYHFNKENGSVSGKWDPYLAVLAPATMRHKDIVRMDFSEQRCEWKIDL